MYTLSRILATMFYACINFAAGQNNVWQCNFFIEIHKTKALNIKQM